MNTPTPSRMDTRKMVILAVLAAVSYVVMLVGRVPVVLFLKYDPKDVIIAIGGFIYGPLAAFGIAAVVSFVEMITVSTTGPIGLFMNLLSSASFACTASYIYSRKKSLKSACIGLVVGAVFATCVMMLWNYYITPYYMRVSREKVAAMMIPAFLPFNVLKWSLNAALTMLLYKPLVTSLRKAHLISDSSAAPDGDRESAVIQESKTKLNIGVLMVSLVVLVSCVLAILVFQGKI